jgi:hypothetical protein
MFVTFDFRVLHGIMREISPGFDVRKIRFIGEKPGDIPEEHLRFETSQNEQEKVFTEMIETDGVAVFVHYSRLKADRPVPSSLSPLAKREENKEADPATQKVQDNDFVVGANPGNTNIVTIAVPRRAEDGTDGNLRQKDMCLLRLSRARYYRESGIVNARKKIGTWNAGMKDHLEALSEATSRGADFEPFRKFMEVRVAHGDALWAEYTKPRWARLRMNLYCGKQRAVANFFNRLNALKENESQRLVVAY